MRHGHEWGVEERISGKGVSFLAAAQGKVQPVSMRYAGRGWVLRARKKQAEGRGDFEEAPSTRFQAPKKHQAPNFKLQPPAPITHRTHWSLEFETWSFFDV
jgi:hypothetical protein